MSLSEVASISITKESVTPNQATFDVPLVLAAHSVGTDLVRTYESDTALTDMVTDGFSVNEPAYLMVAAVVAQDPSPATVKVGKRNLAPGQTVTLTCAAPAIGDVYTITAQGTTAKYTAVSGDDAPAVATALTTQLLAIDGVYATSSGAVITLKPEHVIELLDHTDSTVYTVNVNGTVYTHTVSSETLAQAATAWALTIDADTNAVSTASGAKVFIHAAGSVGIKLSSVGPADKVNFTNNNQLLRLSDWTSNITYKDTTADPGVATDLNAVLSADSAWFGLVLDSQSKAEVEAAAAWAETNKKLFGAQTSDTECTGSYNASSSTDVGADLKKSGGDWSFLFFSSHSNYNYRAARAFGAIFPLNPGSETWDFKSLKGDSVDAITTTAVTNVQARNMATYRTFGARNLTRNVVTGSGEYVDVTRFDAWLKSEMETDVFNAVSSNSKLPFTDAGVDVLTSTVKATLQRGVNAGGLVADSYVVTATAVKDVSSGDKAARNYKTIKWSAVRAGAIHKVTVQGRISL